MSVYLVGAGPGDPGLITVRGLELLRQAEALVFDRLVADELIDEAPRDALRVAREPLSQDEINELLVTYGRAGLKVVRLKGGDPYLFGRGSEEVQALLEGSVEFEVVPGVTALSAAPAAAGLPLTRRGVSSQIVVISGHSAALDFAHLADTAGTLVVFMGLSNLTAIATGLISAGMRADLPAAVISQATTPEQELVVSSLADIADAARKLRPPALIVIGATAALASERPLGALLEGQTG